MTALIRRRPLVAYYVLAFGISVVLGLLLNVSLMFGLLALFGPALAAVTVARTAEGRAGLTALRAATTRWRVHPAWYVAAVGLPVAGFAIGHVAWVIPVSFLLTWLWLGTRSAWLTTLMHGAANLGAAIVFPAADASTLFIFGAVGMGLVAAVVVVASWTRFTASPANAAPPLVAGLTMASEARAS